MIQKIIDLLLAGNLEEVNKLLGSEINFPEEIEKWSYDTNNIILYTLISKMLIKEETAEKHRIAAYLLSMPLCAYNGAYSLGLYHARRALALNVKDISNKIFLLIFHNIPENLIKKDEAIQIAQEILSIDSSCLIAQNILQKYGIRKES